MREKQELTTIAGKVNMVVAAQTQRQEDNNLGDG